MHGQVVGLDLHTHFIRPESRHVAGLEAHVRRINDDVEFARAEPIEQNQGVRVGVVQVGSGEGIGLPDAIQNRHPDSVITVKRIAYCKDFHTTPIR